MRIVSKNEIEKLARLVRHNRKEHVQGFQQSRLYPPYHFWNATGSERSPMYQTIYVTPKLLAEAEAMVEAEQPAAL
jgi:hypothetical protein